MNLWDRISKRPANRQLWPSFIEPEIAYDDRPPTTNKVWLHTYWFGKGPIYTYEGSKLPPRISKAWMVSVMPPYYRGSGIAIRLRNTTIRFGICYPQASVLDPDGINETLAEMERGLMAEKVGDYIHEDHWHAEVDLDVQETPEG